MDNVPNPMADEHSAKGLHLSQGQDIGVEANTALRVGLEWEYEEGQAAVDLDVAAVGFDSFGSILDAAFFNSINIFDGAVKHSGDVTDGKKEGFDEFIDINLAELPDLVSAFALVINAHKGGSFKHVESATATIQATGTNPPTFLADASIGCGGDNTGLLLAVLYRKGAAWSVRATEKAVAGRTFVESLPDVREAVDVILDVDPGLKGERTLSMEKTFDMTKGGAYSLPESLFRGGDDLFIGLGWECPESVDLDASVIAVYRPEQDGQRHGETIYYGRKVGCGGNVKHQGDNTTGDGAGDDEVILMDLDRIDKQVESLVVTVTVFSESSSFSDVHHAYIRLVACKNHHELARFKLDESVKASGLIFLKIARSVESGMWNVEPIGQEVDGPRSVAVAAQELLRAAGLTGSVKNSSGGGTGGGGGCCSVS